VTQRLDLIKAILEQTTQKAEANRDAIAQICSTVNSLVQVVEGIFTKLREIRTESQRILKHLFSRQENGE
jgi:hypothetical protein